MKMTVADTGKYPNFAYYVRHDIPLLINNKSIVNNLKKEGDLSEGEIRKALTWGTDPLLVVTDLSRGQCGGIPAVGCARSANPNQIEIDTKLVLTFESSASSRGSGQTSNGSNVFVVGVTILHELCHLGHYWHNKKERGHAGDNFENAVYGKPVP